MCRSSNFLETASLFVLAGTSACANPTPVAARFDGLVCIVRNVASFALDFIERVYAQAVRRLSREGYHEKVSRDGLPQLRMRALVCTLLLDCTPLLR